MKLLHRCLAIGAVAVGLTSCSQEAPWGTTANGEGKITLHLSALNDVKSAAPVVRAEGEETENQIVTPPIEDFKIRLTKIESGVVTTFSSVKDFVEKSDFPVGKYEIEAFYGDENAQGMVGENGVGYENAYYTGLTTDITVIENQTTDVELHASLANSVVEIEYTDEFKRYFPKWSTTFQSDGHAPLELGMNEGRSYIIPGQVAINMEGTQQNGETVSLRATTFLAEAQHRYKMKYNIYNGEVGNAMLEISFDENLQEDPVTIDLSKLLKNIPAPTITPIGFEPDEGFQNLSGTPFDRDLKFNVVAHGGIQNAFLTLESDTYSLPFMINGKVDLCNSSEETEIQMTEAGIHALGFFKNRGDMAQLDLSNLCKTLPDGRHTFRLEVIDSISQTSGPMGVTIASLPVEIYITPKECPFEKGYADISISYNGLDPTENGKDPFTFEVVNDFGQRVPCNTISVIKDPSTRSAEFPCSDYTYRIEAPCVDYDQFELYVLYDGQEREDLFTRIPYQYSPYEVEVDPMANKLCMRVKGFSSDSESFNRIFKKIHVFVDDKRYKQSEIKRDASTGIITIPTLESDKEYQIRTTLISDANTQNFQTTNTIKTEVAAGVPNGDFEDLVETINTTIQQGGRWTITNTGSAHRYSTTLSMMVKEPRGWTSSNSQTCNLNSSNLNSWYVIPSVYNTTLSWLSHQPEAKVLGFGQSAYDSTAEIYNNLSAYSNANAMVIRNVAWDHNGVAIPDNQQTGNIEHFSNYFCSNHPSSIANRSSGYLLLDGETFSSRPTKLKGYYKYTSDSNDANEKGVVEIELLNGSDVVASGRVELDAKDNYTDFEVPISYPNGMFLKSVDMLKIKISSSNKTSDIKTTDYCNKEECCSRGATLYIDALTFEY